MPGIASLERFKGMPENTQDEFTNTSSDTPDEEGLAKDESVSPTEQPADVRVSSADETPPQPEQPAATEPVSISENMLPPEAQGEANGGPLGCCLGTMIGLVLSLSLAILSRAYATSLGNILQGNYWLLGLLVRILMGIMAFALAFLFGYAGWRLGKRFYREYEPPQIKRRGQRSGSKKPHQ